MMPQTEEKSRAHDRAIRLFTYLQELVQLRTPQVRDVEKYESVLWFTEIPHEDGCHSISWGTPLEDPDVWLEVRKKKMPTFPAPPTSCKDWLDSQLLSGSEAEPRLMDRIFISSPEEFNLRSQSPPLDAEEPKGEWVSLSDRPDVSSEWQKYLAEKWSPWAE